MTDSTYTYLLNDAQKAIEARKLNEAITALSGAATCLKDLPSQEEAEQLRAAYDIMLSYFASGAEDPTRQEQFDHFLNRCSDLLIRLMWVGTVAKGKGWLSTRYRQLREIHGKDLHLIGGCYTEQMSHCDLFDTYLLSPLFTVDDVRVANSLLNNVQISETYRCLVVSALTLSCLNFYDSSKLRILLNEAGSAVENIRVRAFVGVILVSVVHRQNFVKDKSIQAQVTNLMDERGMAHLLETAQMSLFLSLESKNVDRRISNEIIPQIFNRMKEHRLGTNFDPAKLNSDLIDEDLNPKWKELANDRQLKHFFKDFVSLQQKGADLYLGTFRHICPRFRFFDAPANWFYPFTFAHPELPEKCQDSVMTSMMLRAEGLNDTDKYAFCLMSNIMSADQNDLLLQKFSPEMIQSLKVSQEDAIQAEAQISTEETVRLYIQSLYRFFHVFSHRSEMVNPFQHNLFLGDIPPYGEVINEEQFLLRLADFAFDDHSYSLSLDLYDRIPAESIPSEVWQKKGYCQEQLKNMEKAVKCYEEAVRLHPESVWTLKRLSTCLRKMNRYAEAELHLLELEKLCPEDMDVAMQIAECFMQEQIYDEAFKRLYKADYFQPNNFKVKRALAWCLFLAGKYQQAKHLYEVILRSDQHLTSADYLNAGHVDWLCGNVSFAAKLYLKSCQAKIQSEGTAVGHWDDFFGEDRDYLLHAGLQSDDLQMMTDLLTKMYNNSK